MVQSVEDFTSSVMESNRTRCRNFGQNEVSLLIHLVKKYRNLIQNTKKGAVSWQQKTRAWEQLSVEFNANSGCSPRTSKMLKEKWTNLKKTSRRKNLNNKAYRFETNRGPCKAPIKLNQNAINSDIKNNGLVSEFDSDCIKFEVFDGSADSEDVVETPDPIMDEDILRVVSMTTNKETPKPSSSEVIRDNYTPTPGTINIASDLEISERATPQLENTTATNDWNDDSFATLKSTSLEQLITKGKTKEHTGEVSVAEQKIQLYGLQFLHAEAEEQRKTELHALEIQRREAEEERKKDMHEWAREEHSLRMKILTEEHLLKMQKYVLENNATSSCTK